MNYKHPERSMLVGLRRTAALGAIALGCFCRGGIVVAAQTISQDIPSSPAVSSLSATPSEDAATDEAETKDPLKQSYATSLDAEQIIAILEARPEIVIELKSLLADTMQQQSAAVDEGSITDEMLYSQISTNRQLRSKITIFLRARGYINEDELQRDLQETREGINSSNSSDPAQRMSQIPGSATATTGLLQGQPLQDTAAGSRSETMVTPNSRVSQEQRKPASRAEHNVTDPPDVLRVPTPYNLLSLHDLYSQVPDSAGKLKRFGSEVFLNRRTDTSARLGSATASPVLDTPVGPDYVVGPGDSLTIDLWGSLSQSLTRVINRDGRIMLPEAGDVQLAGLTLERAQGTISKALQRQFHNAQVSVTVSRLRTIRVYVVGDVQRPGAYDISSLSSPLSALYSAGGPTATGSLRILKHYRGQQLIGRVDLYDFLLRGVRSADDRLQGGDTLVVPPVGEQVAISGAVKRPGIYELKDEKTLSSVLENAGGTTVAASLEHISVERIDSNQHRETISLNSAHRDLRILSAMRSNPFR